MLRLPNYLRDAKNKYIMVIFQVNSFSAEDMYLRNEREHNYRYLTEI